MEFPSKLKQLCQEYFEEVEQNPGHLFNPAQRLAFYSDVEALNIPKGKLFLEYIQLVSAQYVLPIWDNNANAEYYLLPRQMLALAEDVLEGKVARDSRILAEIIDYAYHLFGNLEYDNLPATALSAGEAGYRVMGDVKTGKPYKIINLEGDVTDEDLREMGGIDATGCAILAYAAICEDGYPTGNLDPAKSLEFWKWWLFEAIPKAWDLSH